MVSRSRERALITWIEKSFVFFDDLRARGELGERPVAGESAPFVERALAALEGMYGDRKMKVTTAVYLAGRKTVGRRRPEAAVAWTERDRSPRSEIVLAGAARVRVEGELPQLGLLAQ